MVLRGRPAVAKIHRLHLGFVALVAVATISCGPQLNEGCPPQADTCADTCVSIEAVPYDASKRCVGGRHVVACMTGDAVADDETCARRTFDRAIFLGPSALLNMPGWEMCAADVGQEALSGNHPQC